MLVLGFSGIQNGQYYDEYVRDETVVKGEDNGGGTYEGKGDLGSGGMWQVDITAQRLLKNHGAL